MSKFWKGVTVRCIDDVKGRGLRQDKTYTVTETEDIYIKLEGYEGWFLSCRFELYEEPKPQIDWSQAPTWANYAAMDENGEWFFFEKIPYMVTKHVAHYWWADEGCVHVITGMTGGCEDWTKSLVERPKVMATTREDVRALAETFMKLDDINKRVKQYQQQAYRDVLVGNSPHTVWIDELANCMAEDWVARYDASKEENKYMRDCPYDQIDIYRVLNIFNVTDPCIQHAVKKLLVAGGRGHKDIETDIEEAIQALERWQDMREEEELDD